MCDMWIKKNGEVAELYSDVIVRFRVIEGELRGFVQEELESTHPIVCLVVPPHLTLRGARKHMEFLAGLLHFDFYAGPVEEGVYYIPDQSEH